MIKVLHAAQIREADQFTIANEPVSSIDLMERASRAFVRCFRRHYAPEKRVLVFCGVGNNGGDGLAVTRLLSDEGYRAQACYVGEINYASQDFLTNYRRVPGACSHLRHTGDFPAIGRQDVVIDALFGSGLNRPVSGLYASLIRFINQHAVSTVAIDIASGLFADQPPSGDSAIIRPERTISFQVPKLAFFQPRLSEYVGEWHLADIGLSSDYLKSVKTRYYYLEGFEPLKSLRPRKVFFHKGDAGRAQLWVGSKGKTGAAILAAKACLRTGVGLLFLKTPAFCAPILQGSVPEAMVDVEPDEAFITTSEVRQVNTIGIGPGIGSEAQTMGAFAEFLRKRPSIPMVLDADAINMLAQNIDLLRLIPESSILTPHPGEFERLVGTWTDDYEKLSLLRQLAVTHQFNVVLKGAYSAICNTRGDIFFNATGNAGMAVGGSGDVLFGIICGMLAQGVEPEEALKSAVYIHGQAGDLAKDALGEMSMLPSDIISFLPEYFKCLGH